MKKMIHKNKLSNIRCKIDRLDKKLTKILVKRFHYSPQVAKQKWQQGEALLQLKRLKSLLQQRKKWAEDLGLSLDFIEKIFYLIHDESLRIQKKAVKEFQKRSKKLKKIKTKSSKG